MVCRETYLPEQEPNKCHRPDFPRLFLSNLNGALRERLGTGEQLDEAELETPEQIDNFTMELLTVMLDAAQKSANPTSAERRFAERLPGLVSAKAKKAARLLSLDIDQSRHDKEEYRKRGNFFFFSFLCVGWSTNSANLKS